MSGVEVAAVVVPVAIAASSGGLAILKGPAAMLRNAQKNVDESRCLLVKGGIYMDTDERQYLKDDCKQIEDQIKQKRAAGDHKVKHAYKPKVWTSTRELEHRSEHLYTTTRTSSARSLLDESDRRILKDAARKASKESAKAAKEASKAAKGRNSDGPGAVAVPTKKSINGLNEKTSQSSIGVRSGRSGASRTEVIPPLPIRNDLDELRGESFNPTMRGLPSKSEASRRDGMKNPVRRVTVA